MHMLTVIVETLFGVRIILKLFGHEGKCCYGRNDDCHGGIENNNLRQGYLLYPNTYID